MIVRVKKRKAMREKNGEGEGGEGEITEKKRERERREKSERGDACERNASGERPPAATLPTGLRLAPHLMPFPSAPSPVDPPPRRHPLVQTRLPMRSRPPFSVLLPPVSSLPSTTDRHIARVERSASGRYPRPRFFRRPFASRRVFAARIVVLHASRTGAGEDAAMGIQFRRV